MDGLCCIKLHVIISQLKTDSQSDSSIKIIATLTISQIKTDLKSDTDPNIDKIEKYSFHRNIL